MDEGEVEKNGGGVCSSETVNGGEDVFSCDESDASSVDHLVIMVHGILGRYVCGFRVSFILWNIELEVMCFC